MGEQLGPHHEPFDFGQIGEDEIIKLCRLRIIHWGEAALHARTALQTAEGQKDYWMGELAYRIAALPGPERLPESYFDGGE